MKPVFFKGHNVVIAKDQPQYRQLPALVDVDGNVLTEWELNEAERLAISQGENLKLSIMTFNTPLQPVMPYVASVDYPAEQEERREILKKESYPAESEVIEESVKCECGKEELLKYATIDDDGIWTCHECFKQHCVDVLSELRQTLVNKLRELKLESVTPIPGEKFSINNPISFIEHLLKSFFDHEEEQGNG